MGPTIFEIKKFPKCTFLTSLDAARAPDAESLINEISILLVENAGARAGTAVRSVRSRGTLVA